MKTPRLLLAAALPLLLAGCGADGLLGNRPVDIREPAELSATVLASTARPGSSVDVRFENSGDTHYWFHPCNRSVLRFDGEEWVALPDELRVCTAQAYGISANSAVEHATDVPSDARPGLYRFAFPVIADVSGGVNGRLVSTSFQVD